METPEINNNDFEILNMGFDPYVLQSPRAIPTNILKWGRNNLAPDEYLDLYYNSPTQMGIINKKANLTTGKGLTFSNGSAEFFAKDINFDELWRRVCIDYWIYNIISVQCVRKIITGELAEIIYQDPSQIRKTTDDSQLALLPNWTAQTDTALQIPEYKDIKYVPVYDSMNSGFIFKTFNQPGVSFYSFPEYFSAISSILTEIDLIEQRKNFIRNNFSLNSIVKVPTTMSKAKMLDLAERIKKEWTGPKNAGKILMIPADGDKAIEILPISSPIDGDGIAQYIDQCRMDILIAHSIPSLTLIGLPGPHSLAGDGASQVEGMIQLMDSQIIPVQMRLIKFFEGLFADAGYPTEITINNEKFQ